MRPTLNTNRIEYHYNMNLIEKISKHELFVTYDTDDYSLWYYHLWKIYILPFYGICLSDKIKCLKAQKKNVKIIESYHLLSFYDMNIVELSVSMIIMWITVFFKWYSLFSVNWIHVIWNICCCCCFCCWWLTNILCEFSIHIK